MFVFLYNLSLKAYLIALNLAAPFNAKAKKWLEGRKGLFSLIEEKVQGKKENRAWFHCASLGEFEQARPVIERFRAELPDFKIVLTFFSPSGYEIRKNYQGADYIFYLPLDTATNARKFLDLINPNIAYFVKYEFWFHYLNELHKKDIPGISFSAIFRENQIFFKEQGKQYKDLLKTFEKIFVQDSTSQQLLEKHELANVELTGDTRFDRVLEIAESKKEIPIAESFKEGKKLIVIGSAWEEDIKTFLPVLKKYSDLKIIVAPHEIHEGVLSLVEKTIPSSVRYSAATTENVRGKQVLIIDNIGLLSSLYSLADFSCIGGAFGKGLHNTLEAAVYGMPLFFGPNFRKFKEAKDLIRIGSAFSVESSKGFETKFDELYKDDIVRKELAERSVSYVKGNAGATDKIIEYSKRILR